VKITASRGTRTVSMGLVVTIVAGCALPRSGPTRDEIFAGSVLREGDAFVVVVDDHVTRATAVTPALGFGSAFLNAGVVGADTISPGDVLGLQIYENVDSGILTLEGGAPASVDEVQVDSQGFIFVPYAGRIQAAGNTPESLRQVITRQLDTQTPDPQVIVRRVAGDGSTVTLVGDVGGQGVYPIERPTRTLTSMLAAAGGVQVEEGGAKITVFRGRHQGSVWLEDLYSNPANDIALRPGDRIVVEADSRSFTAMGATGAQSRVPFDMVNMSAIEALAQVGGLNPNLADPQGIFVFRNEPEEVAEAVTGQDLTGSQRFVYVLNLTEPNGIFMARDFVIRDGDTVYVTEAPFTQWQKTVSALTGTLGTVISVSSIGN
jgi:polysaccharide biosynthesis/export protein